MLVSDTALGNWWLRLSMNGLAQMNYLLWDCYSLRFPWECSCARVTSRPLFGSLREKTGPREDLYFYIVMCASAYTMHINLSCYSARPRRRRFLYSNPLFPTFWFRGAQAAFLEWCRFIPHAESVLPFHRMQRGKHDGIFRFSARDSMPRVTLRD